MKIDLFKLNNFNQVELEGNIEIPSEYYKNMDIRDIKSIQIDGILKITYDNELELNLDVSGEFILPCAITLDDVVYPFSTKIEYIIGKFEDFYNKNKNTLDILPFIWENIVSEVPIKVTKPGMESHNIHGNGWELISSD